MTSVIIPCYNSGIFIEEALASVHSVPAIHTQIEILIVDDGSQDPLTVEKLKEFGDRGNITIIYQSNRGPAAARNVGVERAQGEYIVFLDSDNKILSPYFLSGIEILKQRHDIGVVYGKPIFFGDKIESRFESKPFDKHKLFFENYIDTCTLIRKSAFQEVGGFDESIDIVGHEDWDLWLTFLKSKWGFYFLDEYCFEYRLRTDSLITKTKDARKQDRMRKHIAIKHWDTLIRLHKVMYELHRFESSHPFRKFFKSIFRNSPF